MMGTLKQLFNNVRYRIAYRKVQSLPEDDQRKIGYGIYSNLYDSMSEHSGEATGGATVWFQCDYDGHVTYYLRNLLQHRADDPEDCTLTWVLEADDIDGDGIASPNEYKLTVVARGKDATAASLAAEASAMSAILKIPTVYGNFKRMLFATEEAPIIPTNAEAVQA